MAVTRKWIAHIKFETKLKYTLKHLNCSDETVAITRVQYTVKYDNSTSLKSEKKYALCVRADNWVSGSRVMGQQIWMFHVGHGSVPVTH